jgi:hypothetical protein
MTLENPIGIKEDVIEEPKEATVDEQLATALARCEELYGMYQDGQATIAGLQTRAEKDAAEIARLADLAERVFPQQINAMQAVIADGASKLQQIAAIAMGGVDIVGVLGEVETALGKIKTKMAQTAQVLTV